MHAQTHKRIYTQKRVHTHTHAHTHTRARAHAHTRTQTPDPRSSHPYVTSHFSPSNARSRQQVEGRIDKKQEGLFECAHRNKKWSVKVCDVALYEVVRSVRCCARYNTLSECKTENEQWIFTSASIWIGSWQAKEPRTASVTFQTENVPLAAHTLTSHLNEETDGREKERGGGMKAGEKRRRGREGERGRIFFQIQYRFSSNNQRCGISFFVNQWATEGITTPWPPFQSSSYVLL